MNNDGLSLFGLAEQRLGWLERRQGLLAQNIANANTPGFVAKDLRPFAQALQQSLPELAMTDGRHLAGSLASSGGASQPRPAARAPDRNAVSMEEQLTKVADTDGAQALVTNLYRKYLGFFRLAAGK